MQEPKVIRWGIIGLGKIAHKFAQDLATVEDCQLYAVASRNQKKANKFKKKYKATIAYGSYEELINDKNVDAVYIATPHKLHKSNTIACLKAKKSVLCEKPLAMNHDEVQEMIDCARDNQTLLMEALWTYFLPHYKFVLKHLENETYGKLLKIEADFGFKPELDMESRLFKKSLGGGSLLDIGIYPIFSALSTLGEPDDIDASATFLDNEVDTSCNMLFKYKNGATAHLKSTLIENTATEAIFHCENGTLKINSRFHEPSTVTCIKDHEETVETFGYNTIGYSYEIDHFNQLIRDQKTESNIMTFDFSEKLIKLLDRVRDKIGLSYP
ncbi:Gfo/Idh/MocA family protein [Psychroserpens sp. XS_ASV72]|uniref:Gfo/Idh/MocA family protein n=1 Tax=Psychroserpens sp. XS_ASV72 TaxID=3241293 RepID=UPI00351979CB